MKLVEQLTQLRTWFAASIGEAFGQASAIAEPAGTSAAWQAVCARYGVLLIGEPEREQVRAAQRPTRGAPMMELEAVVAAIVREARYQLGFLHNVHNDDADALHEQIRRAVDAAESETLRAYRNAVLPRRTGGMFANATVHVAANAPHVSPATTMLTCRTCGAPQLEAGAFDCKYCGNRMV